MNMNEKNKIENCRIEPKLKLINMDSVEVEQVEWLLYPFIPYGKVTIIQGDPGEGKTTMVLQIIAKLTRGEPILPVTDTTKTKEKRSDEVDSENEDLDAEDNMQEQSSVSPVNVIYQTAEDGLGDTIKPRLLAAGADCSKVLVIDDSDQPLTMADVRLEEAIVQTKARMVVLDPIQGFLGADVDMHRANEIRPLMKRIAVLSEKYHCAVILIGHMNKNSNGKSSYRGLGSIDFQAAARSVLIVGRVKDEPEVRVVYGMLRKQFLKEHRLAKYQYLLLTGKLTEHLNQIDQESREQVEMLMEQMAEKQGVTEELKVQNRTKWVRLMNNIKASAEEMVLREILYI